MTTARSKIDEVKKTYEEIAKDFSNTRGYLWPDLKPFVKVVKPKESVLDVGCGNGRLLLGLPKTVKYTGLDISSGLLKEAERIHPGHHFIETDITEPGIWKHLGKFDHIFCVALMHHLPDRQSQLFVLKQIKSHLKPKATLLITVWNLWQTKYIKYHVDPGTKWRNPYWVNIPFKGRKRFCFAYTKPYLVSLLKEAGLPLNIKRTEGNYLLYTNP